MYDYKAGSLGAPELRCVDILRNTLGLFITACLHLDSIVSLFLRHIGLSGFTFDASVWLSVVAVMLTLGKRL